MDIRIDAKHHLAGIGLLRFFTDLPASLDVIIDSLVKGLAQGFDRLGVEADAIADACHLSGENAVPVIIGNASGIALVGHAVDRAVDHGVTPILSR